jgi:heme exporter protein A
VTYPLLETRSVYRRYGRQVVLRDVSVSISPGESVGVFGANGAGKSTLLRMMATLTRPSRGEVLAFGEPVAANRIGVRRRIGVVGHQPYVYPELTCRENLRFFATMFKLDPDAVVLPAIEAVGLGGREDSRASTLSRGLLQRLNIARATLHQPDVLILDEPDTGLDRAGRAVLEATVQGVINRGGAVVLTTHAHEFGLNLSNRTVVLQQGHLVWDGPSTDLTVAELDRLVAGRVATEGGD